MAEEFKPDDIFSSLNQAFESALSKVGKAMTDNLNTTVIAKTILDLDDAAVAVAKSFGQGRENVIGIKQAMADAYISVVGLGGELQDIQKIQTDVASSLGRNIVLASDSFEKLFAASQVTGKGAGEIVGKFKDELAGGVMIESVNLASKMFAYSCVHVVNEVIKDSATGKNILNELGNKTYKSYMNESATGKGIVRRILKTLKLDDYKECLYEENETRITYNNFKVKNHEISMQSNTKIALTPFDSKRFLLKNGNDSLPYGHYRIQKIIKNKS